MKGTIAVFDKDSKPCQFESYKKKQKFGEKNIEQNEVKAFIIQIELSKSNTLDYLIA